jgi:hypothetical protein
MQGSIVVAMPRTKGIYDGEFFIYSPVGFTVVFFRPSGHLGGEVIWN